MGLKTSGPIVSNVVTSYTPTLTGFGTTSANAGYYVQHGKMLHCWGNITLTAATTGDMSMTIPSGFTIDTAKYESGNSNLIFGGWDWVDASDGNRIYNAINAAAYNYGKASIRYKSSTDFYFGGGYWIAGAATPITWATGDKIHWEYWVAIT